MFLSYISWFLLEVHSFKYLYLDYSYKIKVKWNLFIAPVNHKVYPEAVAQRYSVKKALPQACYFIKKETLAQVFSCGFCEISKNIFSYRLRPMAASTYHCFYICFWTLRYTWILFVNHFGSKYWYVKSPRLNLLRFFASSFSWMHFISRL